MTLVYAKIIGMFVCGADPGGGGWGRHWGGGWTQGKKVTQSKLWIKNSKLFYMYVALLLQVVQTPSRWFKMDTQGSLTHIAMIFKFGDVSGPRAKKWPKVNRRLKIVNYFTCMRHFSCRWYGPQEVHLNGYPRISNPYCCDIQIRRCEWTKGKKITQNKLSIKNSKLFYMYAALLLQVAPTPSSWFKWIPKDL